MTAHGPRIGLARLQTGRVSARIRRRRDREQTVTVRDAGASPAVDAHLREAAHTIRTPLAVARSHAEFVLDGLEPGTAAHDDALVVLDELRRAERISDQLLALGTADRAETLVVERVDLAALAREVAERWSLAGEHAITADVAAPVVVMADRARLRDALDALVENALAASEPDGRIVVGARADAERGALRVADGGRGIAPADLDRIFERYARGSAPRGRGTGLGLAVVRAIAQSHGGEVTVASRPGRGSEFTLRLGRVERG